MMANARHKTRRPVAWQFSLAALMICMTTAAFLVVWRVLAFGLTLRIAVGLWLAILSPTAIIVSGFLLCLVVWFVRRKHSKQSVVDSR